MQSFIIIVAANAKYFELVQGTIKSIRQKPQGQDTIIGFFDLGCTPEQIQLLHSQVNIIKQPDWELNFPIQNEVPEYLKGLLARPFLRQYFPNFDIYLWIDADAWVQDWRAIDLFIQGAERRGLGIVPEIDRASSIQYGGLSKFWWEWVYHKYQASFGEQVANDLYHYPLLNAGVFALHKDAPHWQVWAERLEQGLQQNASIMTDQFALNLAVYKGELLKDTELLPAWCNWTCHYNLPVWDKKRCCFVEPYLPHLPIGIVHLTGVGEGEKFDREKVETTDGDEIEVSLRYVSQGSSQAEGFDSKSQADNGQVTQIITEQQTVDETAETMNHSLLPAGDYVSPNFKIILPDRYFPNMIIGDTRYCEWPYLRRDIPHNWYIDRSNPSVGFVSRDEAHILYNTALKFKRKRALEIGCWMGWSACHLALGGVELDVIDPILEKPEFYESINNSLQAAGVLNSVRLIPGYSPQKVEELAAQFQRKWPLIFIDGNHEAPGPLYDAIACEKFAEDDALILFHDLASPDVAQGLDYLKQQGWKTMIYQTMQIMGVAWRGTIEPVIHQPDPTIKWHLPEHLQHYSVSRALPNKTIDSRENSSLNQLIDLVEKISLEIKPINNGYDFDSQQVIKLNQQGRKYFIRGDFKNSLITFENTIRIYPISRVANKYMSLIYWNNGDLEKSLKHHALAQLGNGIESSDRHEEFQNILSVIRPYTLLSKARLFSLYSLAKQICLDDIPGNFVECGTWRGGTAALLAFVIKRYSLRPRLLYAFDTFEGMPDPIDIDRHDGIPANDTCFGAGTLKAPILKGLEPVCQALDVRDSVVPVQGLFSQTLPQHKSEVANIALLHADGDWYESTLDIFNNLFEQVVEDGIVQIDDYGFWEGCRKAIHEFERSQGSSFALRIIDNTGVWFRKENILTTECEHWHSLWHLAQAAEKIGDVVLAEKAARATLKVVPGLVTAEEMLARFQESPLKEELNLKEINLIVFPNWTQPEELLLFELETVIRAILNHPDRSYMTVLLDTTNSSQEEADLAISSVVMKLLYEDDLDIAEQPEISLIGKLNQIQWKALHNQVHSRIRMKNENSLAIAEAGMESLLTCEIDSFSNWRALHSETGIWQLILQG